MPRTTTSPVRTRSPKGPGSNQYEDKPPVAPADVARPGDVPEVVPDPLSDPSEPDWDTMAAGYASKADKYRRQAAKGGPTAYRAEIRARLNTRLAMICRSGGTAMFPALVRDDGIQVNARLFRSSKHGDTWLVFKDSDTAQSGKPTQAMKRTPDDIQTAGFDEVPEPRRAWATIQARYDEHGNVDMRRAKIVTYMCDEDRRPLIDNPMAVG